MEKDIDYGHPMKPFFTNIQNFWDLEDKFVRKKILGIWPAGVKYFWPNYEHPFWFSESLLHVFHYSTIISTKKLSLYIQIPNITEGLALHAFWNLEKTVLHEICVSGTVGGPLLTQKSPTCTYISKKPW